MTLRLLVLGGTGEARALTERIDARFGDRVAVVYSLAGRTDAPLRPPATMRRGGFGGAAGLADHLRAHDYHAVVDATHPFAKRISRNAVAACDAVGVALVTLGRPAWRREANDNWLDVDNLAAAASTLRDDSWSRVFVTTGRTGLNAFAALRNMFFLLRLVAKPRAPLPLRHYELIIDRGPFTIASETTLLREYRIDVLVTKASGGSATRPKLMAARELGLPVIMLRRPPGTDRTAISLDEALLWVEQRLRERCNADSRKCIIDAPHMSGHVRD